MNILRFPSAIGSVTPHPVLGAAWGYERWILKGRASGRVSEILPLERSAG